MASAIQNDADNLEAALSLLDEYVTHDRDSIREENSFNDYHEIADLCNEVKCTGWSHNVVPQCITFSLSIYLSI